jgi:adenine specific DNA methylase Mod
MVSNRLFYGDNLDVLKQSVPAATVDLVYLDPPFNSNRDYNVIFNRHNVEHDADAAQIQAFGDTWRWTPETEEQYQVAIGGQLPLSTTEALRAFRILLGENDAMAYLVNMAPRLADLHRVLKRTGTLYLHCDPTMSHYLKVLLDTIFGAENFGNEVAWAYKYGGRSKKHFGRKHDVLLRYTKSQKFTFNSLDPHVRIPHEPALLMPTSAMSTKRGDGIGKERGAAERSTGTMQMKAVYVTMYGRT